MPITVEGPDGYSVEFPDDTPQEVMLGAMRKHFGSQGTGGQSPVPQVASETPEYQRELSRVQAERAKPHVPSPLESELKFTPEQEARNAVEQNAAARAEQEASANRSWGDRVKDATAFALSLPVRMASKGEYGLGDLRKLVHGEDEGVHALRQHEGNFVKANEPAFEAMKAVGDVTAGIPMLSTMGAVPGQMLRTSAAAARQIPGEIQRLAAETKGSGSILPEILVTADDPLAARAGQIVNIPPGGRLPPNTPPGSAGGGAVPPGPPPSPGATPSGPRPPTNAEVIEAGKRIDVPIMRALVGNRVEQGLAGGLSAIPYAGTPVVNAFERGRQALGDAAARTVAGLGATGTELVGGNARNAMVNWVGKQTVEDLNKLYGALGKKLKPGVTRPLEATRQQVAKIRSEMAGATSTTPQPAIDIVDEAIQRPGGLSFNGLLKLRSDVISRLDAAKISPEAGTDMGALKRLKVALSKDLKATVEKAGGPTALAEFKQVNDTARRVIKERKSIEKIVGAKGDAGEGAVVNRISQMASTQGQHLDRLRVAKKAVGEKAWNDLAAEISNRMGIDTSTGQWSHNRFMSAYGKLSDGGKQELFGPTKTMFDDIATVSSKLRDLEKLGSFSGNSPTGRVMAVMQLITDPKTLLGAGGATALFSPALAAGAAIPTMAGFAGGRRLAWYLARPVSAQRAGRLIKSYYGVESALKKGGEALARNEEALDNSIRSLAAGVAAETGQSAAEIERSLRDGIGKIRKGTPSAGLSQALRAMNAVA